MGRKPFVILLVLVVLLGFSGGYLVRALQAEKVKPLPAVDDTLDEPDTAGSRAGFCCMTRGSACVASEAPTPCLKGGGWVFHPLQSRCDAICDAMLR